MVDGLWLEKSKGTGLSKVGNDRGTKLLGMGSARGP